jgi:hypothetical protein
MFIHAHKRKPQLFDLCRLALQGQFWGLRELIRNRTPDIHTEAISLPSSQWSGSSVLKILYQAKRKPPGTNQGERISFLF